MSLNDVLNTDVEIVGARLRQALDWWLGELRDMAGPLVRQGGRRVALRAIRLDDGRYRLERPDGQSEPHTPGQRATAALVLPPSLVVVRSMPAPPVPERDIRRAVLLDLDRLTPFPAETSCAAVAVTPPAEPGERARATLAAAPRTWMERELEAAAAAGIEVAALTPADAPGLDLLPSLKAGAPGGFGLSTATRPWLLVIALAAANVGAAIWRDVRDTSRLQAAVAAQQPVAERVRKLRRDAEMLRTEAQARAYARLAGDPLRLLDALSLSLPPQAFVKRLAFDGSTVRVAGGRRDNADVVEALRRSPVLADVRNSDPAASVSDPSFDVAATVRPPPGVTPPPPTHAPPPSRSSPP